MSLRVRRMCCNAMVAKPSVVLCRLREAGAERQIAYRSLAVAVQLLTCVSLSEVRFSEASYSNLTHRISRLLRMVRFLRFVKTLRLLVDCLIQSVINMVYIYSDGAFFQQSTCFLQGLCSELTKSLQAVMLTSDCTSQ